MAMNTNLFLVLFYFFFYFIYLSFIAMFVFWVIKAVEKEEKVIFQLAFSGILQTNNYDMTSLSVYDSATCKIWIEIFLHIQIGHSLM